MPQEGEGVWAPFFGRPAYTMTLPAKLAQLGKAAILLTYAERLPRRPRLRGALRAASRATCPAAPAEQAAAINRAMEQLIARCPAQYFWSYNRYKRPQGVAGPGQRGGGMRLLIALMWLLHWLPLPVLGRLRRRRRQPDVPGASASGARSR